MHLADSIQHCDRTHTHTHKKSRTHFFKWCNVDAAIKDVDKNSIKFSLLLVIHLQIGNKLFRLKFLLRSQWCLNTRVCVFCHNFFVISLSHSPSLYLFSHWIWCRSEKNRKLTVCATESSGKINCRYSKCKLCYTLIMGECIVRQKKEIQNRSRAYIESNWRH